MTQQVATRVTVGVDTHADAHVAVAKDSSDAPGISNVCSLTFPT